MAITVEHIATNRYAPQGADSIDLYSTGLDGGSNLTLGQLAIAVSMRAAAAYESESVMKMNKMADGSEKLDAAARYMEGLASETITDWAAAKAYLKDILGITDGLPDTIDTYAKRMSAVSAIKTKVDALTQQQQEEMIDLQTLVNRRDVAYSASSNIVRAIGTSMDGDAANF